MQEKNTRLFSLQRNADKELKSNFDTNGLKLNTDNFDKNTIIFGATGSGKTKSILLPILDYLIQEDIPGLVVDVKNNFTDNLYMISEKYNKNNILEIGNHKTADNINIINGLSLESLITAIRSLNVSGLKEDYWFENGISIFQDISKMYYTLYEHNIVEKPTLYILAKIITEEEQANFLYFLYIKNKHLYKDEFEELSTIIETNHFHLINYKQFETDEDERTELDVEEETDKTRLEQLQWTIGQIRTRLKPFMLPHNIIKFSNVNNTDFTLDFNKLYYEDKKIITLRFLNNEDVNLYKLVTNIINVKIKEDIMSSKRQQRTFRMIDEYQNIIIETEDNDWLDKSREFLNMQFFATQSLDSLLSHSYNQTAVMTILDNCKNKISLQSNNISTMNYFNDISIGENKPLKNLSIGESKREYLYNDGEVERIGEVTFEFYSDLINKYKSVIINKDELNIDDIKEKYKLFLDKKEKKSNDNMYIPVNKPNGIITTDVVNKYIKHYLLSNKDKPKFQIERMLVPGFNYDSDLPLSFNLYYENSDFLEEFETEFFEQLKLLDELNIDYELYSVPVGNITTNLLSDKQTENCINLFMLSGNEDELNFKSKNVITDIKNGLDNNNIDKSNFTSLNILCLGDNTFRSHINYMADISYSSYSIMGLLLIKDLISDVIDTNYFIDRKIYTFREYSEVVDKTELLEEDSALFKDNRTGIIHELTSDLSEELRPYSSGNYVSISESNTIREDRFLVEDILTYSKDWVLIKSLLEERIIYYEDNMGCIIKNKILKDNSKLMYVFQKAKNKEILNNEENLFSSGSFKLYSGLLLNNHIETKNIIEILNYLLRKETKSEYMDALLRSVIKKEAIHIDVLSLILTTKNISAEVKSLIFYNKNIIESEYISLLYTEQDMEIILEHYEDNNLLPKDSKAKLKKILSNNRVTTDAFDKMLNQ